MAQSSAYKIAIKIVGSVEKSFNNSLKNANKTIVSMAKVSAAATAAATTALMGLGTVAIKAGVEYESAFAGVKKTVDATDEQLAKLDQGIRDMARTMPTSAVEIAGVAEAAGQLGIKTDNILDFTRVMTQLGDATNLSADEAATTLARFANITGMSQTNFDRLGSTIVALGNNYATTEAEITEMGLRLAAAGSQIGMSEAEILGFSTALSSVGLEAEAGGSAMSKLMVNMQLATEGGGAALEQYAKVAGVSASELKKSFQTDSSGAIMQFLSGLNDTERLGKSAIAILDDMGLSEVRLRDTILRASSASGMMKEAIDTSNKAWKKNTALTNEVEQRYETMESQFKILKNGLTNLGIEFYNSVRNPLADILKEANSAVDTLTTAFQEGGLDGLTSSLGTVLAGGVTMIADYTPDIVDAGVSMVQNFVNGINENSEQIASSVATAGGKFVQGMLSIAPSLLLTAGRLIINFVNGVAQQAPMLIQSAVVAIMQFWQGVASMLPQISQSAVMLVMSLVQGIGDNLPLILQSGVEVILSLTNGLLQSIPILISGIMQVIQYLILSLLDGNTLGDIIEAGITITTSLAGGLIQAIAEIVKGVMQIVFAIINTLMSVDWKEVAINIGKGIVNGLKNGVKSIGSGLKSWLLGENEQEKMKEAGKDTIDNYASGIQSGYQTVSNATNGLTNAFAGMDTSNIVNAGQNMGINFTNGFATGVNVQQVSQEFQNTFKNIDNITVTSISSSLLQSAGENVGKAFTNGMESGINGNHIATLTGSAINTAANSVNNTEVTIAGEISGKAFTTGFASSAGTMDMTQFNTAIKATSNQTVQTFASLWQTVQTKTTSAMNSIKNTVIFTAKSTVTQIKSAFENMTIKIPKPKLPVISTSYKTETYGKDGNVKIPSFNVSWNAVGGIFKRPTIFNTASAGMQGVGEAGAEAILPLDLLWKKMSEIVAQNVKNNQSESIFETLQRKLTPNQQESSNGNYQLAGAGGSTFVYSPQYNLYGTASKKEVEEADKMSRTEFDRMMKQWQKDNNRKKF